MTSLAFLFFALVALFNGTIAARLFRDAMTETPGMVVVGAALVALLGSVALLFGLYAAEMAILVME